MDVFPTSPIWGNIDRGLNSAWGTEIMRYDTGLRQSLTPRGQPLYVYTIPIKNMGVIKQSSLNNFFHDHHGQGDPFLFKDPYDFIANSVPQVTSTNMNSGDGFFFIQQNSWLTIPDSAFLYIEDTRSGEMLNGTHFVMSQDNGFISLTLGEAISSLWVSSFQYFRKAAFANYTERSILWEQFSGSMVIEELLPNNG